MNVINGGTGASVVIPTPGNYIIGIKYDPKSLVGRPVPIPPTITLHLHHLTRQQHRGEGRPRPEPVADELDTAGHTAG